MIYEIKTEEVYENFSKNEEMFDFRNYSAKSKHYDYSNKLVVGKTKDKRVIVAVEEFVRLKPKMFCWIINILGIRWIEFKVKVIE